MSARNRQREDPVTQKLQNAERIMYDVHVESKPLLIRETVSE
jgi:hypothetical protein